MTVQKVVRTVATDTLSEAAQAHVEPYRLIHVTFPVAGEKYWSEGQQTTYNGNVHLEAAAQVGKFSWSKDGKQTGSIILYNSENNDAAALVLSNRMAGNPVQIYQTYRNAIVDSGTVTSADAAGDDLIDSGGAFDTLYLPSGSIVKNITDGSSALITAVDSATNISHDVLTGGNDNQWGATDDYEIIAQHTTPVLYVRGECSRSTINPDTGKIVIQVVSENAATKFVPNRYFTPAEGFNHIPATGRTVVFGGETFLLERAK